MPRFFIDAASVTDGGNGKTVTIVGDDAHHISRSLRIRIGEVIVCCDGRGVDYVCSVASVTDSEVTLAVERETPSLSEPPYRATVFQALVKEDKLDTVIQKSVELGAVKIVPFITPRCTVKFEGRDVTKKTDRWNRIALEAAKQCGRGIVPTVSAPVSFGEMLEAASACDVPLFCYEKENISIREALPESADGLTVSVVVGPEGGFSEEEVAGAVARGMKSVSLGRRILRTESASGYVLSALSFALEKYPIKG